MESVFDDNFNPELFNNELHKNYIILSKEYRNEFFYKNTLFNKYVLGKYSLNTTAAYSEIAIGNSKADFVIINHNRGIVYEIKTDLDNLERLIYQLEDYYKVFDEVYVVTSEKNYYPVYKFVKEFKPSVGIIVLTDKVNLSVRKQAIIENRYLNHENLFKLLRKKEYEQLLFSKFGSLPNVKPVQYFKICMIWFKRIEVKEAQKLVFTLIRKRMEIENIGIILDLPMPIRWLVYSGNFTKKELFSIYKRFN
ncbi:sce7726 family protein [Schinkia sp. CFF1]